MCNKKHVSHRQTWKTTGGGGEGATPSACYRDTVLTDTILVQFYNAQGINGNGDDAGGGDDDDGENDGDDDDAENNGDDDDDDGDSENDSGDDDDILHFTLQLPLETIY